MTRAKLAALMLLLAACDDDEVEVAAKLDGSVDAQVEAEERASLDLLLVIDNTATTGKAQVAFARELPRFVDGLLRGELGSSKFPPVRSLHVGVVTTNVGGATLLPPNLSEGVQTCLATGDDGVLQGSIDAARDGYIRYPGVDEFGDPVVLLEADPACALGAQPRFHTFAAGVGDANALSCVARPGVLGCAFEQPFESMWKALAPQSSSDPLYQFVADDGGVRGGQGDRANQGFLRANAALAVVLLSDEDDCSITGAGRALLSFSEAATTDYGALGLRCGRYATDANLVQPVERYVRGLRALKPAHPERVVFTAITGLPADAVGQEPSAILERPEMQFREDVNQRGSPVPVCTVPAGPRAGGKIYPAIRAVKLVQALGQQGVLGSLCADDFRGALERTAAKLAPLLE